MTLGPSCALESMLWASQSLAVHCFMGQLSAAWALIALDVICTSVLKLFWISHTARLLLNACLPLAMLCSSEPLPTAVRCMHHLYRQMLILVLAHQRLPIRQALSLISHAQGSFIDSVVLYARHTYYCTSLICANLICTSSIGYDWHDCLTATSTFVLLTVIQCKVTTCSCRISLDAQS